MLKYSLLFFAVGLLGIEALGGPFDQFGTTSPFPMDRNAVDPEAKIVVFQPNYLAADILPETAVKGGEEKFKLQSFATPGEYEPFVFALRSDRATELAWNIAPLVSTQGDEITPEWYELRIQRTLNTHADATGKQIHSPLGLDRCDSITLNANETVGIVLDVKVPENAKPGTYQSTITLTGAQEEISLPVMLRVLPFQLVRDTRSYGSYFPGNLFTYRKSHTCSSPEMLDKLFQAHRAYGFNSAQFCEVSPHFTYKDGKVTADFSEITSIVNAWRKAGNNGMISLDLRFGGWWIDELSVVLEDRYTNETTRYTIEQLENIFPIQVLEGNLNARWSKDYRLSETCKELYRQFQLQVMDLIQQNNWQDVYLSIDEELGNGGLKLWGFEQFTPQWAEFEDAKIMLYDNSPSMGVDMGHKYKDLVDIRQYNYITPEVVETARADNRELWYYNRGLNRACFGLPVWKLNANGVHMWADQWFDINPYSYDSATYHRAWTFFWPSPEGPLPSLAAITAREGIDDLGYVDTLLDRIAKLEAAGKAEATTRAKQYLQKLKDKLPLTNIEFNDYKNAMTINNAFAERWKIASEIIRLEKELNHVQ